MEEKRKVGRPKKDEPKKEIHIKLKVTEEERKMIKHYSIDNDISVSDLIRLGLNTIGGFDLEYGNKKRKTRETSDV